MKTFRRLLSERVPGLEVARLHLAMVVDQFPVWCTHLREPREHDTVFARLAIDEDLERDEVDPRRGLEKVEKVASGAGAVLYSLIHR